jgi:hypothetical protein
MEASPWANKLMLPTIVVVSVLLVGATRFSSVSEEYIYDLFLIIPNHENLLYMLTMFWPLIVNPSNMANTQISIIDSL